jgi:hypothetical protein
MEVDMFGLKQPSQDIVTVRGGKVIRIETIINTGIVPTMRFTLERRGDTFARTLKSYNLHVPPEIGLFESVMEPFDQEFTEPFRQLFALEKTNHENIRGIGFNPETLTIVLAESKKTVT